MPKPILQSLIVADNVYCDNASGKWIIAGTFTRISASMQKAQQPGTTKKIPVEGGRTFRPDYTDAGSPTLYLCMTEVQDHIEMEIRYVRLSDYKVEFHLNFGLDCSNPLATVEMRLPLPKLLPRTPVEFGAYAIEAICEGKILGSWRIQVVDPESDGGDE